jgi:hypothetical protein
MKLCIQKKSFSGMNFRLFILALVVFAGCNKKNDTTPEKKPYDLSISLVRYTPNQIITEGNIFFEFEITNRGTETIPTGTILYASAKINGVLFSFDLLSSNPTAIPLETELKPGQSKTINAGYLEGKSTLAYLQTETADFCLVLWGIGEESINNTAQEDTDPSNNEICITYASYDLAVSMSDYTEGQTITEGDVNFAFKVTNNSKVTFPAGTSLMASLLADGQPMSLDLSTTGTTEIKTDKEWAPGTSITFSPGKLQAQLVLAYLRVPSVDLCVAVWGIGKNSLDSNSSSDTNFNDNISCITISDK